MCHVFFNDTATTEIYTLSLHDALPISLVGGSQPSPERDDELDRDVGVLAHQAAHVGAEDRQRVQLVERLDRRRASSEEHTSELQSRQYLACRLLLEKNDTSEMMDPATS